MKQLLFIASLVMLLFIAAKCDQEPTADQVDQRRQEYILKEGVREIGMPAIKNFQEKKTLKWILELRDDAKILNYAYVFSEVSGKFTFIGKCIGYPLPYATQYTNPQKTVDGRFQGEFTIIPQADPNGLFSPASAEGTWVLLVNPKNGEAKPMYIEPKVTVVPFPLSDAICTINTKN